MIKTHKRVISLMTVTALSSLALANAAMTSTVQAETPVHSTALEAPAGTFQFLATVVDSKGQTLSGKSVVLTDTTDVSKKVVQTVVTDAKGQALFSQLPINRSLSVSVDGVVKGYTVCTSQANSQLAASFTAQGVGQGTPNYTKTPLDVYVRNQDAEAIADKAVTLKDSSGNLVETVTTGKDGLARFTKGLMDGTFYAIFVDGKKMSETVPGMSVNVALDTSKEQATEQPKATGFNFLVTILDKEGKVLEGKEVALSDITDGKPLPLKVAKTNAKGQILFEQLPLSRNISVTVDGKSQGYTVRTDQNGQLKEAAFYAEGKGSVAPEYTKKPLTITVRDSGGNGLAGQTVTLVNDLGQTVAEMTTDAKGKATFVNQLMDGMFYNYLVNGIKMDTVTPGNDISAYLKTSQIKKADEKPMPEPSDKTDASKQKDKAKGMDTKKAAAPVKQEGKTLPKAGDKGVTLVSLIGLVILGIAGMLTLTKAKMKP
ncbi:MSCRAMM family protein [Streptococcus dysgalactiae]|uniref:MSCRAMM family protein n=1 Tax=Streptococcus dysgalactiae TaxID=1334 RepID=UPI001C4CFD76|nr:LPXTG cell wall anchor domain-containing protein [Streptococcus dysgalactiae]